MTSRTLSSVFLLWLLLAWLHPAVYGRESRSFQFPADALAYTNQLSCDYELNATETKMIEHPRVPRPPYTLRCVVVARTARQFFQHARFEPGEPKATAAANRFLIRLVLARSVRSWKSDREKIVIPGFANLREFSRENEALIKAEGGGAWQSFVQRGNWRMLFPFSPGHQDRTAHKLIAELAQHRPPLVHVVCFPELTLNHVLLLFDWKQTGEDLDFSAYDPNRADGPIHILYGRKEGRFLFPSTPYFAGGPTKLYWIYRGLVY